MRELKTKRHERGEKEGGHSGDLGVKSQNTGQEREKSVKQRVRGEMESDMEREGGREGIKEIERK